MTTLLLILHLLVTLTLIATVLVQRSEGGGLGIGSSQGMGSFMSGRGTANLLTRTTAILAAIFMALSLALAVLNRGAAGRAHDILALPDTAPAAPAATGAPLVPTPGASTPGAPIPGAPIPGNSGPAPLAPSSTPTPALTTAPAAHPAAAPSGPPIPGH